MYSKHLYRLTFAAAPFLFPEVAYAVAPPDLLINAGASLFQLIATLFIIGVGVGGLLIKTCKKRIQGWKGVGLFFVLLGILALALFSQTRTVSKETSSPDNVQIQDTRKLSGNRFSAIYKANPDLYILDIREDVEIALGKIPGSVQMRYADLLNGGWKALPKNETIYVYCYGGVRSKLVSNFLEGKGVSSRYLDDGAYAWSRKGGYFEGSPRIRDAIKSGRNYSRMSLEQYNQIIEKEKPIIIDGRLTEEFQEMAINGSLSMPFLFTPKDELDDFLLMIPEKSAVLTVCDNEELGCHSSLVLGLWLQERGHTFLGRFRKIGDLP